MAPLGLLHSAFDMGSQTELDQKKHRMTHLVQNHSSTTTPSQHDTEKIQKSKEVSEFDGNII